MILKRVLAGALALSMILPLVACGNEAEESSQSDKVTVPLDQFTTASNDGTDSGEEAQPAIGPLPEGAQTTIKWMSERDLNPYGDNDRSTALVLFEDVCGGKIEWIQTTWQTQYTDLANAVLAERSPDMFPYSGMSFPMHVSTGFYKPIDEIVDFDNPLWSDMKATADQFALGDDHYVAPVSSTIQSFIIYDKTNIEENGFDDPWELYQNGDWNWNKWVEIMQEWVALGTEEEPKYGVNGWFQPQLVQQTGKTMVNYVDGKFVQNLFDPDIERVETLLYDLAKDGIHQDHWYGNAANCFKTGKVLFYAMGEWASTGTNTPKNEVNWGVVPIPTDPNNTSGQKIATVDMTAYMWVKGSTANDAVKAWFNCNRVVQTDQTYIDIERQKFFTNNPYWTEEMYEGYLAANTPEHLKMFDYAFGISTKMSDETAAENEFYSITKRLYEYVCKYDEEGTQFTWTQVRDTYLPVVESELADLNAKIEAMQNGQ